MSGKSIFLRVFVFACLFNQPVDGLWHLDVPFNWMVDAYEQIFLASHFCHTHVCV